MKNKTAGKEIKNILSSVKQMVLCTCKQNKPWAATVIFAFDENFNLYFFSSAERRHSKEIVGNDAVAGAIASEHKKGLYEPVHLGLQFEGLCKLVSAEEAGVAYELYRKQHPRITEFHERKDARRELYKIRVRTFVVFDTS